MESKKMGKLEKLTFFLLAFKKKKKTPKKKVQALV